MFPLSLKKNIRELTRQISLLETECKNMEAGERERVVSSKTLTREMSNKLSISNSGGLHSPKMLNLPLVTSKTHSLSCRQNTPVNDASRSLGNSHNSKNEDDNKSVRESCQGEGPCGDPESGVDPRKQQVITKGSFEAFGTKKSHKFIEQPSKVTEFIEDHYPIRIELNSPKEKNISKETSEQKQNWCELLKEQILSDKNRKSNKKIGDDRESWPGPEKSKLSSVRMIGAYKREPFTASDSKSRSEIWAKKMECLMISQSKPSAKRSKRRPRSSRTKKKSDEMPLDAKAINEKEIQYILWNKDREKTDFVLNPNDSIRTLHLLTDELKTKSTREKRYDVLNHMRNSLKKVSGLKSKSTLQNPLQMCCPRKGNNVTSLDNEENVREKKKVLDVLTKFCQEQWEEKFVLTQELNSKNRKISHLKNKEKEYLSLISNIKFNLEHLREEAEESQVAKRELLLVEAKLREGTKVIEALKKSHGKMQAMIEHYVLENDKLRAAVNMAKLESQKFHVLLAGKEVEIDKYKQEIELFQKQISQQLKLLRSEVIENEVENAIAAISTQTNVLQTEVDSLPSETTLEKGELSATYDLTETMSSIGSQVELENDEEQPSGDYKAGFQNKGQERKLQSMNISSWSRELNDVDTNVKVGGLRLCKSEDSMSEMMTCDNRYNLRLHGVLSSSKNLRSSINEMLQGMQRNSSEKFWPSPPNPKMTFQYSLIRTSSENNSDCPRKD